jgi:hypothetical protein
MAQFGLSANLGYFDPRWTSCAASGCPGGKNNGEFPMTKYQWHNPEAAVQKSSLTGSSKTLYDDVREFMEGLEKEGLLADTGEKSWSELSGRFEIVWEPTELAKKLWASSHRRSHQNS